MNELPLSHKEAPHADITHKSVPVSTFGLEATYNAKRGHTCKIGSLQSTSNANGADPTQKSFNADRTHRTHSGKS